jgi:hypothetical protein
MPFLLSAKNHRRRLLRPASLGLVLLITLAWASQARAAEFHSETAPTELSGTQTTAFKFTTKTGTFQCSKFTVSGSVAATTASQIELTPKFSECTGLGFAATFDPELKFKVTWAGVLPLEHIIGRLKITNMFCTITIEAQLLSGISFTNTGSGTTREFHIAVNDSSVTYSQSGPACGGGSGTYLDGLLSGTIKLTGKTTSSGAHVGIWSA